MIAAGSYYTLTVSRISPHGLYLSDGEGNEVLLPNRYVSLQDKVDDTKEVFVYHDSEERLVATTLRPLAAVGQTAFLEVVDKTIHGVFLNWGEIPKDLFVPNRNQQAPMEAGRKYIVYLYRDDITGRVVGTAKLKKFIANDNITVSPGDKVSILVAARLETGYRAIVNDTHWGMVYHNQIFRPIRVGDRTEAYVRSVTDDGRIDLSLQGQGYDEVKAQAARLMQLLEQHGGALPLGDRSDPEEVVAVTQMSKKTFKRALGYLLKQGLAEVTEEGFRKR